MTALRLLRTISPKFNACQTRTLTTPRTLLGAYQWNCSELRCSVLARSFSIATPLYSVEMYASSQSNEMEKLSRSDVLECVKSEMRLDSATGKVFAVIMVGGAQFKVVQHDIIMIHKAIQADIGEKIRLEKVLAAGCCSGTLVGMPLLKRESIRVEAMVMEKTRGEMKIIFKKNKRKKRWRSERQDLSVLKITNIELNLDTL